MMAYVKHGSRLIGSLEETVCFSTISFAAVIFKARCNLSDPGVLK